MFSLKRDIMRFFISFPANAVNGWLVLCKINGFTAAFRNFAPHLTDYWVEYFFYAHLLCPVRDF